MQAKTCCVTGHRQIPQEQWADVENALRVEVRRAIEDGYVHFISGFARGADLMFAAAVAEQKQRYPGITLEAALPYAGRLDTPDARFHELLMSCDAVNVACQCYVPYCFEQRNRYMVENSQLVIAVFDGRSSGGTAMTLRYARRLGREIRLVQVRAD